MRIKVQSLAILALLGVLIGSSALISGCADITGEAPTTETTIIEDITPDEAYALIQDNRGNKDFIIIDVRTPEEYAGGYIEDAINLDYYSETFGDELDKLDKNKMYLIYCRSGRRSAGALDMMAELGFREVYNMVGGIVQWEAERLPIVK